MLLTRALTLIVVQKADEQQIAGAGLERETANTHRKEHASASHCP